MIRHHPTRGAGRRNCQSILWSIQTHEMHFTTSVALSPAYFICMFICIHFLHYVFFHDASRPSSYGFPRLLLYPLH